MCLKTDETEIKAKQGAEDPEERGLSMKRSLGSHWILRVGVGTGTFHSDRKELFCRNATRTC